MANLSISINDYMNFILSEDKDMVASEAYDKTSGAQRTNTGKNGSSIPKDGLDVKIDYGRLPGSRFANIKALNIWYLEFKPKWKKLKSDMKTANVAQEQEQILWKQKKLLLNTRDAILQVPESLLINIACITAIVAITIGLSCSIFNALEVAGVGATHPSLLGGGVQAISKAVSTPIGAIANVFGFSKGAGGVVTSLAGSNPSVMGTVGIVSEAIGVVYTVLKLFALSAKWGDPTHSLSENQKFTGVMSKQLLLLRLNKYIARVDANIQSIVSGKILTLNNKVASSVFKFSDQFSEKVIKAATNAGDDIGSKMTDTVMNQYFTGKKNSSSKYY